MRPRSKKTWRWRTSRSICWDRRATCCRMRLRSKARGAAKTISAFLRDPSDFTNLALVEQPNVDFGHTIVRQFLIDAWQLELFERLQSFDASRASPSSLPRRSRKRAITIASARAGWCDWAMAPKKVTSACRPAWTRCGNSRRAVRAGRGG